MSILTKICVVVLVVLILLACPVFITKATVDANWKHAYELKQQESTMHEQTARSYALAADAASEKVKQLETQSARTQSASSRELERLQNDLAAERLKVVDLTNEIKGINSQLTQLQETLKATVARNELQLAQLEETRSNVTKTNDENLRLTELYKTTQSQVERLESAQRSLREELAERDRTIKQLETQLAGGAAPVPGEVTAAGSLEINGTITAVKGDLASINVGSAQGVQKGMRLIVYRGPQWVANLRIEEVDVTQSAGIVIDRQIDPKQGDKVTSTLKS